MLSALNDLRNISLPYNRLLEAGGVPAMGRDGRAHPATHAAAPRGSGAPAEIRQVLAGERQHQWLLRSL